jgi:hypothetical protein
MGSGQVRSLLSCVAEARTLPCKCPRCHATTSCGYAGCRAVQAGAEGIAGSGFSICIWFSIIELDCVGLRVFGFLGLIHDLIRLLAP